jgi:hypothetical protein
MRSGWLGGPGLDGSAVSPRAGRAYRIGDLEQVTRLGGAHGGRARHRGQSADQRLVNDPGAVQNSVVVLAVVGTVVVGIITNDVEVLVEIDLDQHVRVAAASSQAVLAALAAACLLRAGTNPCDPCAGVRASMVAVAWVGWGSAARSALSRRPMTRSLVSGNRWPSTRGVSRTS